MEAAKKERKLRCNGRLLLLYVDHRDEGNSKNNNEMIIKSNVTSIDDRKLVIAKETERRGSNYP